MAEYYFQTEGFPALHIQCQGRQITAVDWVRGHRKRKRHGSAAEQRLLEQVHHDLVNYFAGKLVAFDWPLRWPEASPFQRSVWRALENPRSAASCQLIGEASWIVETAATAIRWFPLSHASTHQ